MFTRILLINFIILTLSLSACTNVNIFKKPQPNLAKKAELLKTEGNYLASANEYLRLARSVPPAEQARYQLSAVQSFLEVGMVARAKAELAKVSISQDSSLVSHFQLTQAQLAMAEGQTEKAALRLQVVNPKMLSTELRRYYYETQAQVFEYKGNILDAVHQRVRLDTILDAKTRSENRDKLWQSLQKMRVQKLQGFTLKKHDVLSGWIALALLYKTTRSNQGFKQALSDWQTQFPNHPATQGMIENLSQSFPTTAHLRSKQIALLLPFDSRREAYAKATYRGFMAASYADESNAIIKVYDVNPNNVSQVYQKALNDGANFVVGPLQKESINALLNSQVRLAVPTLALNVLDATASRQNFYQFSLSPEDEAENVAVKMWADGHRAVAVLAPKGELGERVSNAFQKNWFQRGGQLLVVESYGKNVEDSINKIMQQKNSINAIFMLAAPKYGRQIKTALKYYSVDNFPIYSTSHIYDGADSPRENIELDGVIFGDMPWRIAPTQQALQLQSNFQRFWPDSIPHFSNLYAFGIDAYHLLSRVTQAVDNRFGFQWDGQTGRLLINENGVIRRQWLHWAKFVNGVPYLLDSNAPRPDDSSIPDSMQQESLIRELEGVLVE